MRVEGASAGQRHVALQAVPVEQWATAPARIQIEKPGGSSTTYDNEHQHQGNQLASISPFLLRLDCNGGSRIAETWLSWRGIAGLCLWGIAWLTLRPTPWSVLPNILGWTIACALGRGARIEIELVAAVPAKGGLHRKNSIAARAIL